jgi:hypothetical protein
MRSAGRSLAIGVNCTADPGRGAIDRGDWSNGLIDGGLIDRRRSDVGGLSTQARANLPHPQFPKMLWNTLSGSGLAACRFCQ